MVLFCNIHTDVPTRCSYQTLKISLLDFQPLVFSYYFSSPVMINLVLTPLPNTSAWTGEGALPGVPRRGRSRPESAPPHPGVSRPRSSSNSKSEFHARNPTAAEPAQLRNLPVASWKGSRPRCPRTNQQSQFTRITVVTLTHTMSLLIKEYPNSIRVVVYEWIIDWGRGENY